MRSRCLVAVALLGVLACVLVPLATSAPEKAPPAAYTPPKGYVCYRVKDKLTIDGKLDEADWKAVPWTDDFVDIEGGSKPKPRFRTRVKMLWDDDGLYLGAELTERHVWATLREHDSVIFQDNDFEVFLNPNGDSHLYAELELNALNTTWDLLLPQPYKDGGLGINAWEILGLRTAVHIDGTLNDPTDTDRGWTVEIAWPWKGLRELTTRAVPPKDGDQWRINFSRVEWRHEVVDGKYRKVKDTKEDNWVWSPQGVVDMHRPETWGYVQFSTSAVGKAEFQLDPTGPARHLVQRVYYAQRAYREKHDRWATTLEQLDLKDLTDPKVDGAPKLETTTSQYEVTAKVKGTSQRVHLRPDARVWVD
jgi:hypothetical protein